jgi:hypothetical protein
LAGKRDHQSGLAFCKTLQDREDFGSLFEVAEALGAIAQFAGSLRATKEQFAKDGGFAAGEVEDLLQMVLVFGHAAIGAARWASELLVFETAERVTDLILLEMHHRLTAILLVAGVDKRVKRKRVVLRCGGFLFDERTQNAGFYGSAEDGHESRPGKHSRLRF